MSRLLTYAVLLTAFLLLDGLNRRANAQHRVASTPESVLAVSLSIIREPVPGAIVGNVEVALTNQSGKPVIAYNYEITRSVDGVVRLLGTFGEDLVPSFASVSRKPIINSKYQHFGPLQPGQQRFIAVGVDTSAGLQSLRCRVKAVAFADGTGVGDPELLQGIFGEHAAASKDLAAILPMLRGLAPSRLLEQVSTVRQMLVADGVTLRANNGDAPPLRLQATSAPPTSARSVIVHELTEALLRYKSEADMQPWWNFFIPYMEDTEKAYREHSVFLGVQP